VAWFSSLKIPHHPVISGSVTLFDRPQRAFRPSRFWNGVYNLPNPKLDKPVKIERLLQAIVLAADLPPEKML
jgi:hypothetical protein